MTTGNYESGDIKLVTLKLTNFSRNATIDIRGQAQAISIFEDIEEPTVYAEIVMVDSIGLVKDFPIIGEELLEVSFITPGREKPTVYNFSVFSVDNTSNASSGKASVYTLKCVSREHFWNAVQQVDKSYKTTVDEIIIDILENILETKKKITVEATRGLIPVTVPRSTPFEAVDFLRQKAVAKRPSGGVFVFFENQYGFQFISLEKLIEDGKKSIASRVFTYSPTTTTDKKREAYSMRNIQRFQHLTKMDTINKAASGLYKNTSRTIDLLTREFAEVDFELDKKIGVFETGEKKVKVPNSETLINDAKKGSPMYMFAPKDSSKGNDYVSDLIGYRKAFVQLFNQNVTRAMVYGDNYLTVGDMVTLNLPDTSGTTGKKSDDKMFSGNYMITKLRHIIFLEDKKFKHNITFDCNKIGIN